MEEMKIHSIIVKYTDIWYLTLLKSVRRDKLKSYEEIILRLTKDIVTSSRISWKRKFPVPCCYCGLKIMESKR